MSPSADLHYLGENQRDLKNPPRPHDPKNSLKLRDSQYPLDDPEKYQDLAFWKQQTGIHDSEQLRQHILRNQKEAYSLFPYGCIAVFAFTWLRASKIPGYERVLQLPNARKNAIFVDIGCCFGTDTRKFVIDGWPACNIIATDIRPEFWDLGHKLFCSTSTSFPTTFLPGDILDPSHLDIKPVYGKNFEEPMPEIATLTSLNPLRGHVSAIHIGAVLHLFTEEQQLRTMRALAGLLSSEPGSVIMGSQSGAHSKGVHVVARVGNGATLTHFCHSPESWKEMIDGIVFSKGTVRVETQLIKEDFIGAEEHPDYHSLLWSITRL